MIWTDHIIKDIHARYESLIAKKVPLVIRDEKTISGRVHVGSLRGVAVHGTIDELLAREEVAHTFLYELNDFDVFDSIPEYLDKKSYEPYLGAPLMNVPFLGEEGRGAKYPEYFGGEFQSVIEENGFHPSYYWASELYRSGKMNEVIRTALEQKDLIREIYKEVSGSIKHESWLPVSVICEQCGKIATTQAETFDGVRVGYRCRKDAVSWTHGCGYEGSRSPFDGNAKLLWKVEWAAKFKVLDVHVEGGGKDHSTKGGARDVANHIAEKVFHHNPPIDIPYEFFLVGGKKMSSSKGRGASAREVSDMLPPHLLRLAMVGKDINQAFNFVPDGDTIPLLYDLYDELAENYFAGNDDDRSRIFRLIHAPHQEQGLVKRFLPRFSQVAFLIQMPHIDFDQEMERLKGDVLSLEDQGEIASRAQYASTWLTHGAPDKYRFELALNYLPEGVSNLSDTQKQALGEIARLVESQTQFDGQELHTALHEVKNNSNLSPKEFFEGVYVSFLGKNYGPKAGWFLSVLDRDFLIKRLKEASVA